MGWKFRGTRDFEENLVGRIEGKSHFPKPVKQTKQNQPNRKTEDYEDQELNTEKSKDEAIRGDSLLEKLYEILTRDRLVNEIGPHKSTSSRS